MVVVIIHTIHIRNALTCTNFNFGCCFFNEQITPQSVFVLFCFFVENFTPNFKSTGRAIL